MGSLALLGGCAIVLDFDGYQAEDAASSSQGGGGGATTSGTGAAGGDGGSVGSGASGGNGGMGAVGGGGTGGGCTLPSQCPGVDTECEYRTCISGECGMELAPVGFHLFDPIPGNCTRPVCNGEGAVIQEIDTDPLTDNNDCTLDSCVLEVTVYNPTDIGSDCGVDGLCDGMGNCRNCTDASGCPASSDCLTWMCPSDVNGPLCVGVEMGCGSCQYCLEGVCTNYPAGADPEEECMAACNGSGACM